MSQFDEMTNLLDSAAPSGCARQAFAIRERTHRLRRRGPRSQHANLRRSVPKHRRALPGMSPGETGDSVPVPNRIHKPLACDNVSRNDVSIYSLNVQCLLAHLTELAFHLELYTPHVLLLQETWLNQSHEDVVIEGYELVSRRDRSISSNRGGVATYRRLDFNGIVHIENCKEEERSWHFLRLAEETILLANWYRPGSSTHDGFTKLHAEISQYYPEVSGVLALGDLNVHH